MPLNDITYAKIDPETGVIIRLGVCSGESLELQGSPDEVLIDIPDSIDDSSHYWDGTEFSLYPDKPADWCVWTGTEWVDPRTPEDQEAILHNIRESASLTKLQFVMAVVQAGIISQASGLAMLDGTLPTELNGLTNDMTDMEKFELSAKLKGALQIDRLDPFIIAAGQFLGLTDEQMDAVFGIEPTD